MRGANIICRLCLAENDSWKIPTLGQFINDSLVSVRSKRVDISYCVREGRHTIHDLEDYEVQFQDLEVYGSQVGGEAVRKQVGLAQLYRQLLLKEAKHTRQTTQSRIYQWGDKLRRLLPRLCQAESRLMALLLLRDMQETPLVVYYRAVYALRNMLPLEQVVDFVDALPLKTLTDAAHNHLDEALSEAEIIAALSGFQSRKAPSPNGLPGEFCKVFMSELGNHFLVVVHATAAVLPSE
ncbi:hypothetical protein NDU88_006890 [Pleurodeles waltl]|uniref:Uncharacterized protein n=1 Tax=Pleurodeles waltl TaxID=8319 RepID=A0AAV7VRX8_PLEWA|nr:hypothetical protein NDU88_006890 [Pleurodeles waltl]